MLNPELGDELICWAWGDATDDDKSIEGFLTSAYSTTGAVVVMPLSSIRSIDRLRRSGGSITLDLFDCTVGAGVGVDCFIGLLLLKDLEEYRGLTSGGIDEDIWRIGGLGGGEDLGEIAESNDFEICRLRCGSLEIICGCCAMEVVIDL